MRPNCSGLISRNKKPILLLTLLCLFSLPTKILAQPTAGVYISELQGENGLRFELKLSNDYAVLSVYETTPPRFVKTLGGYYELSDGQLNWQLEFNSAFEEDGLRSLEVPIKYEGENLLWGADEGILFQKQVLQKQPLDGQWLFATRGPDEGQERRGDDNPRKTLKFLMDGRFQWIAYHTGTMAFSGSGGGAYAARDGNYVEEIEYFSRDNDRVGARLEFNFELRGPDWHHTGLNSRGEPMYEIWARR